MEMRDSIIAEFADLCGKHGFWKAWWARETIIGGLKVSAIVGSILVLINQGDVLLAGAVPPIWKLVLTYCVPFGVSTFSTAAFKVRLARREFCAACRRAL